MTWLRRLYAESIWHPDAIPSEDWKYRNLKRIWMPFYFVIAIYSGAAAIASGSRLLFRLFGQDLTDWLGAAYFLVAFVALVSVAFPRLWAPSIVATSLLAGMVAGYISMILVAPSAPGDPNWFIVGMLGWGLPLSAFYVNLLGEEIKERRAKRARDEEARRD